jgi:Tol biopolymer transport system component
VLGTMQPLAPRSLERVLRKCMAKDPDQRWQTARDLADELRWIAEGSDPASSTGVPDRRTVGFGPAAVLVTIIGALAAWAGWSLAPLREPLAPKTVTRFAIQPTAPTQFGQFDFSPDGTALAYTAGAPGGFRLFIRRLDQFGDSPVPGIEQANSPLFSPDGQWVAYFSGRRLMKVNVKTMAAPILLSDNIETWLNGATWLTDGTIIFSRPNSGLQRVSAEGGEPVAVTSLSQTPREFDHHSPTLLPGGRALLFTVHESDGRFNVVVETLATAERKLLIRSAYDARYVASGHLVFARDRAILAVPFDLQRLEVTGPQVTLVEPVDGDPESGSGGYRLSVDGTLVFLPERSLEGRMLTWVDRTGAETPLPIPPRAFSSPMVSPDGRRLAFAIAEGGRRDIWTYELSSERLARLTRAGDNRTPIWTRDGQRLTYSSKRGDAWQLFWQPADGSGQPEPLVSGQMLLVPGSWSTDDRVLVYTDGGTGPAGSDMFALSRDGERKPQPLVDTSGEQRQPSLSPDGRWLAYLSTDTGRGEVFVSDFPAAASRHQVSVEGGREPKWSRDGRELAYRFGGRMFAVPVDTSRGFSAGKPRVLFEGRFVIGTLDVMGLDYDLAPDGRFLMVKPGPEEQLPRGFRVVLNWVDELARRVPKAQ